MKMPPSVAARFASELREARPVRDDPREEDDAVYVWEQCCFAVARAGEIDPREFLRECETPR